MGDDFDEVAETLREPGMGTEHVAGLLTSLVLLTRPRLVVEVGAGYTTPHLLRALAQSATERRRDAELVRAVGALDAAAAARRDLLVPHRVCDPDDPVLVTIDDLSDDGSSARRVAAAAAGLDLSPFLRILTRDFRGAAAGIHAEFGPPDLVWFDAGGAVDAADLLAEYWPVMRPGGLVVLHGTQWTIPVTVAGPDGPVGAGGPRAGGGGRHVRRQQCDCGVGG
ncbi:class I SAM-dependent methyltransferase, partial [Actinoplanes sp. NPDC026623]|uniref:class I SAM-dependent methyltransferase n=1 Tax=Actinoplanes sp. NPDC026623 TaxID=3155610 RepID=UPI0033F70D89